MIKAIEDQRKSKVMKDKLQKEQIGQVSIDNSENIIIRPIELGQLMKRKAAEFKKLGQKIPSYVEQYDGYGDLLIYSDGEIRRAQEAGIKIENASINIPYDVKEALEAPLNQVIDNIDKPPIIASGAMAGMTISVYDSPQVQSGKVKPFFQKLPISYVHLIKRDDLGKNLDLVKEGLGRTWRSAWQALDVPRHDSAKNAATHGRTVIDELSWAVPYEHVKKLPWCRLDNKDIPTRASRYAWILYGDYFPEGLNKQPEKDNLWKNLRDAYKNLQKFIHCSISPEDAISYVRVQLTTISTCLETYIDKGKMRLIKGKKIRVTH